MTKPIIDWFEELPEPIRSIVINDYVKQGSKDDPQNSIADALMHGFTWSRTFNREFYRALYEQLEFKVNIKTITLFSILRIMQTENLIMHPIIASKLTFEDEVKLTYSLMKNLNKDGLKQVFFKLFETILKDEKK